MAEDNSQNLKALETLMDEFFAPTTTNSRKSEIEKILSSFSEQTTAWKDCLYFLTKTNNHYVCMFSLTTLETFIHERWLGMFGQDRAEIRTTLNNFLAQHHNTAPQFIRKRNKQDVCFYAVNLTIRKKIAIALSLHCKLGRKVSLN